MEIIFCCRNKIFKNSYRLVRVERLFLFSSDTPPHLKQPKTNPMKTKVTTPSTETTPTAKPVKAKPVKAAKAAKVVSSIPVIKMTPATHKLFVSLVEDMGNWGGHPMVDVDVKTRANLMDLKVKKLLRTHEEKNKGNPTVQFASFTFVEIIDVAVKGTGIIERFTPSSIDAGVATVVAREIVATK
jgi:hypothetical protein